jgi:ketosteroid isomerase-like protein
MKPIVVLFLSLLLPVGLPAQTSVTPPHQDTVQQDLNAFLQAFNNLDWERFRSAFDDNATVFFPREFPGRATGRAEFEKNFKVVFEQIRAGKTAPPFQNIQPRDIDIQMLGDVAIVTFQLDDRPGTMGRRTIVMQKGVKRWKIVHLHASEVKLPGAQ